MVKNRPAGCEFVSHQSIGLEQKVPGSPPLLGAVLGKYEKLALLAALKTYFQRFFPLIKFGVFNINWTKLI